MASNLPVLLTQSYVKKQRRPLLHLLSSPIALKDTSKAQQAVGISPANVH